MFLSNFYDLSNMKKEKTQPKKVSDFFDHSLLTKKELLNISDIAINGEEDFTNKEKEIKTVKKQKPLELKQNIVKENVYQDLEIFQKNDSVFDSINRTFTHLGYVSLKNTILNPTSDITLLNKKQGILKLFLNNQTLYSDVCEKLLELSKLEPAVLWLYKSKSKEERSIIDQVYFQNSLLKRFNKDENILLIYNYFKIIFTPLYGLLTPVLFFVAPYLYLRFFTNIRFDFKTYFKMLKRSLFGGMSEVNSMFNQATPAWTRYVSLLMSVFMYCHNIYNSIDISINTNKTINEFHKKLNNMSKFLEIFEELYQKTEKIIGFNTKVIRCYKRLKDKLFQKEPYLWSNKGLILLCFNDVLENRKEMNGILEYIGYLDSIVSTVNLYKEFSNKRCQYCLPKILTKTTPEIETNDIWHSFLDPKNVIGNDIMIGGTSPNNIVITGPNAGGKSTFIKSLTQGILFAQTLGIVPALKFNYTPFHHINTYLNIPDCKGKESLFEAEMHRARDHIKQLQSMSKEEFAFVVMDEIFSSTNPEEGIAGGYAIGESLGSFKNSISCITTHYSYITNLDKTSDFTNYKIPITRDQDKNIIYPYKLIKGVSTQYIALELLKQKGFDTDLVDRAMSVCNTLDLANHHEETPIVKPILEEKLISEDEPTLEKEELKSSSKENDIKENLKEEIKEEIKEITDQASQNTK